MFVKEKILSIILLGTIGLLTYSILSRKTCETVEPLKEDIIHRQNIVKHVFTDTKTSTLKSPCSSIIDNTEFFPTFEIHANNHLILGKAGSYHFLNHFFDAPEAVFETTIDNKHIKGVTKNLQFDFKTAEPNLQSSNLKLHLSHDS